MDKINKKLNIILNISISLTIISSFFIIKKLNIPQPFYIFLLIISIIFLIKLFIDKNYYNKFIFLLKNYWLYIFIFFLFIIINQSFYLLNYKDYNNYPLFQIDLLRVISEIILAFILIIHLSINKKSQEIIMISFFIPLILSPLIFFKSIDQIINIFSPDLFSNYALQGLQYNPTSLATWLLITYSFSVAFLFNNLKNIKKLLLFSTTTLLMASLILWTHSRGALLSAIIIFIIIGFINIKEMRKKITVLILLILFLLCGFLILPSQAKVGIFVRYYPQYSQLVIERSSSLNDIKKINIENKKNNIPNFTNAQDRQNFWPKHLIYIFNHPFGMYGPKIINIPQIDNLHDGEHNTIMTAAKWGGWGSMLIFIGFLLFLTKNSIILINRYRNDPYLLGLIMSFLGVFILSMLNSFLNLKTFWILPAMIIGFYLQQKKINETNLTHKV